MKNNKIITTIATISMAACFFAVAVGSGTESGSASKVGEVSKSSKSDSSSESATQTVTEAPTEAVYSVGDVIETKYLRISYLSSGEFISDNQFIEPKEGNKFIYCEFEFENISDSDRVVSSWDFNCFADDNSCEECYYGDEDLQATLSAGRKTKGKIYYEVPENAENIEIEYDASWLSSNKIIFLYK